ncbi:MAG: hypothetical protein K6E34_03420 [Lachnospiraceae bacterium]|nr:hypothetical protein [Lachnospiraceae bacterium]
MLKKQRMKTLTALAVSAAMAVLTVSPVMGEEITSDMGGVIPSGTAEIFEVGDGFVPEDLRLNSDDATGMHYYDETLYIAKTGIYKYRGYEPGYGNRYIKLEDHPGISYNGETHTLYLNNFCLGLGYFDDTIDFEYKDEGKRGYSSDDHKGGDIEFRSSEGDIAYPDITIHLEGHNVIGSYSNFSRVYGESPEITGNARTVSFDGTGDLTLLNGNIDFRSESTGNWSKNPRTPIFSSLPIYKIRWNNVGGSSSLLGFNLAGIVNDNDYVELIPGDGIKQTLKADLIQIGGEKPDFPVDHQYTVASADLGVIGGHSVSVCYIDNIPYSGKKIVKYDGYGIYGISENGLAVTQFVHNTSGETRLYRAYSKHIDKTNVMNMDVYVDGKLIPAPLVSVKYRNNVNAGTVVNNGKTVSPCFCFQIKDKCTIKPTDKKGDFYNEGESRLKGQKIDLTSGLDKSFNKALKEYFRNKENWVGFTIVPEDIRTASPYMYKDGGEKGYRPFHEFNCYVHLTEEFYKKFCNINGNTVKKAILFDVFGKKLKWDKKYTDGKEDPKKHFHVTLSDNYIVYTGQGNYKGSVMIRKSYATGK